MRISEIFPSVQGEGPNAGKAAVFLRMAMCNLTCEWCDTKYTWDWKNYDYEKEVKEISSEQVERELLSHGIRHLVLTGGEPMLQQHLLVPLLSSLKDLGFFIEVETNGTISPLSELVAIVDQWNLSPKLENSGNPNPVREKPEIYSFFSHLSNAYFKYVVDAPEDLAEIQMLAEKYAIPVGRIILMPEARTQEELATKGDWLEQSSKQLGYLFSTRLQIQLWGDRRGT
jgi:organic radical activating enzyme